MDKIEKCEVCEIRFPDIENLKAEVRIQQHMKTPHVVPCAKCDKTFVSITHKMFHQYLSHKPLCPHCNKLCEGKCSGIYSIATEKEGGKTMEMMKQGSINSISDTENTVKE